MKKTRVLIVLILLLALISVAGCGESNQIWVYGSPESDGVIGARLGTEVAENVEVGTLAYLNPYDGDNEAYGVYALYHVLINNEICVYGGAEARIGQGTWDIDGTIEPVMGVSSGPIFVEFQPQAVDGEKDKILFGYKLTW